MLVKSLFLSLSVLGLVACETTQTVSGSEFCKDADKRSQKACRSLVLSDFNRFTDPMFLSDESDKPAFNGFVVSLDKSKHANYGSEQKIPHTADQKPSATDYAVIGKNGSQINFSKANALTNMRMKARIRKTFAGQRKAMFVTGIKPFNLSSSFDYNVTTACDDKNLAVEQTYIDCSFEALDRFETALTAELDYSASNARPYSHIILHSTGWHNRQDNSIEHYNALFSSLERSAVEDFNPLYVGLTWPADWDLPIVSYLNKANDADEVGFIWANYLLNKTLPSAIENSRSPIKPKFVAMGHSFGARVMATAVHSKPYIVSGHSEKKLDTLVLIQPAMSAVRLHNDPDGYSKNMAHFNYYQGIENYVEDIVMTASARDTTNGWAFWSGRGTGHAGTVNSYLASCDTFEQRSDSWKDRFICRQQKARETNDWSGVLPAPQQVLYLRLDTRPHSNSQEPYKEDDDAIKSHSSFKDEKFTDILYPLIR